MPAWERCNHLVQSWVINSVSDSIAQTIVFCDIALEIWIDLKERFSKIDRICIANLRSSINNLKKGAKSVLDYFTEMNSLWEELSSHRPIPSYVCIHSCRCEASHVKTHRNEDQIMEFLTGLNEQFSVVKTKILLLDPLPSLSKVYSLVIQEESNTSSLIPVSVVDDNPIQMNATDARKAQSHGKGYCPYNSSKPARFCTFCNRTNHIVDLCYQKHGYPNVSTNINLVLMLFLMLILMLLLLHQARILPQVPLPVYLLNNTLNLYPWCNKQTWLLQYLLHLALLQITSLHHL